MSPRHKRRRGRSDPGAPPPELRVPALDRNEDGWVVRQLAGNASGKVYRCPGCDHEIPAAKPHVVAWPEEGAWAGQASPDDRRHWHTPCWQRRHRRG